MPKFEIPLFLSNDPEMVDNVSEDGSQFTVRLQPPIFIPARKVDGSNVSIHRQPVFSTDFSNNDSAYNGGSDFDISDLTATGSGTATLNITGGFYATEAGTLPVSTVCTLSGFINTAPVASKVSI
jgi:hypothetical protein